MHTKTTLTLAPFILAGALSLCGCRHNTIRPVEGAETPAMIAAQREKALSLTQQGQRYEQAGRYTQAEDCYRKAIDAYREMAPAWNSLGQMLDRKGDKLAAAEAFKTASEIEPKDPVSLTNLGVLWESIGYVDDAKHWYEEALKRDENHLPALRRLLVVEDIRNHPDELTLEHIRRALLVEKDPFWIEKFQRARGRFEQMLSDYKNDAMSRPDLLTHPAATPPGTAPGTTPPAATPPAATPPATPGAAPSNAEPPR
ncbi:MAG TPA: tetratricopeptide repeat protein [Phycisphaerales bacterium]|nr:tetratricopeptide repeat protein [Phycisphaerales bacterium]